MTLNRHDDGTVQVSVANRVSRSAPPKEGEPGGYLLAWLVSLVFCWGLLDLAVLPWRVLGPRWVLLVFGAICCLLTVLAMFHSRPWRQRPDPAAVPAGNRGDDSLPVRPASSGLLLPSSRASASGSRT
jgi:hypothetical protein